MALADLPSEFLTFSRQELIDRYKRDYSLLNPEADIVSGQPDLDARLAADLVLPIYANARLIADGINEDEATGVRLDRVGARQGLPRGAASGASGYGAVETAAGGTTIVVGDELENPRTKKKYEAGETKTLQNGEHIRIRAKSKGPETDVAPGTQLRWTSPRPGCGQNCTVVEQSDGRGLSGGAEAQNDPRYQDAIHERKANPPAGDNDAELVAVIKQTPDVPVEQVFTYPGVFAGGSSAFTFTILAPEVGASRIPTDVQAQAAFDWLRAQMPGDNSYFPLVPTSQALVLTFEIAWATGGWADVTPWPVNGAPVSVDSASSPTAFVVSGGSVAPIIGQTIAVWDRTLRRFQRKRVATVSGTGPWTLTCTTQNGASDTTYTPQASQLVSPWSDNLAATVSPVLSYLATLGPGELFNPSDIPDEEGRRRIREPRAPKFWPITTTSKVENDLSAIPEIESCDALAGIGVTVAPAFPPKLLQLSDLAFYAA